MQSHRDTLKTISIIYYAAGIFLAMLLSASSAGADYESTVFETAAVSRYEQSLTPFEFTCPVALTASERGTVRARLHNPADRARQFVVRTNISNGFMLLTNESRQIVALDAGEARLLEWQVTPENVAWGRIIFVRVSVPASFSIPARTNTCGILFVNLPLISGGALVGTYIVATLVCILSGMGVFLMLHRPLLHERRKTAEGMIALSLTVVASMTLSLLGVWLIGGALLVVSVILSISVSGSVVDQIRIEEAREQALREQ